MLAGFKSFCLHPRRYFITDCFFSIHDASASLCAVPKLLHFRLQRNRKEWKSVQKSLSICLSILSILIWWVESPDEMGVFWNVSHTNNAARRVPTLGHKRKTSIEPGVVDAGYYGYESRRCGFRRCLLCVDFLQQAVGVAPLVHHVENEADVDTDAAG